MKLFDRLFPPKETALSHDALIDLAFREFLGRDPDPGGRAHYRKLLAQGLSYTGLIKGLVSGPEYHARLIAQLFPNAQLPDLRALRPQSYQPVKTLQGGDALVFQATGPADYAWLEQMIAEHGYYEGAGIWSLTPNEDQKVMADLVGSFSPSHCLELGCSVGSVIQQLREMGIAAEGVEISHMALALSPRSIRRYIHFGDLMALDLPSSYDFLLGLDIFEHFNPFTLPAILERCYNLLQDDAFLLTNLPVFGPDPVFGTLFNLYLEPWLADTERGERFDALHIDDRGWPIHGHLIWAPSAWWQRTFAAAGFRREPEIECAIHRRYDPYWEQHAPARRALYVFSKNLSDRARIEQVINSVIEDRT